MYPSKFYSFKDGFKISNNTINEWLEEIREDLIESNVGESFFISSGNSFVAAYHHVDEYHFVVCNSDGFSELVIDKEEQSLEELSFVDKDYFVH